MVLGILDRFMQKMKLDHRLISHTRINSKWIKDLSVRIETIKILEENTEHKILDISCSNIFSCYISSSKKTNKQQERTKWDYIKLKSFCTAKETINKTKRQPTKWEKILANDTFDKRPICKIYKEIIKLNTK